MKTKLDLRDTFVFAPLAGVQMAALTRPSQGFDTPSATAGTDHIIRTVSEVSDADAFAFDDPLSVSPVKYADANATTVRVLDNGITISKTIEDNGVLRIVQEDLNPDGTLSDTKPWTRIETTSYADRLIERTVTRDDGVTVHTDYFGEGDLIDQVKKVDLREDGTSSDAMPWETITTLYHFNGNVQYKRIVQDNGFTVTTQFTYEGLLFSYEATDLDPNGAPSDLKPWEEKYYNHFDGQLRSIGTVWDDGTSRGEYYQDGLLREVAVFDADDANRVGGIHDWWARLVTYDASGDLEYKGINYDNGDEWVVRFENGVRAQRWETDGDDSHPWALRETHFDDEGNIAEVITYDTNPYADTGGWIGF